MVTVDVADERDQGAPDPLRQSEHSRLLVVDGHPDSVVGVLYAKDLLPGLSGEDADWRALIRRPRSSPRPRPSPRSCAIFSAGPVTWPWWWMNSAAPRHRHAGGCARADRGEIRDERDTDEAAPIVAQGPGRWLVLGGVPLAELEGTLDHRVRARRRRHRRAVWFWPRWGGFPRWARPLISVPTGWSWNRWQDAGSGGCWWKHRRRLRSPRRRRPNDGDPPDHRGHGHTRRSRLRALAAFGEQDAAHRSD